MIAGGPKDRGGQRGRSGNPVIGLAVTVAVAATPGPLSRPVHRLKSFLTGLAVLAAI
jgi:hypothetical protein